MNKNAIKKFAIEARRELISRVGQRASKYGISDNEIGNPTDEIVNGYLLSPTEQMQRAALIGEIKEKGYAQVIEEVAYTWFNRFCALRYMEVNGYLPTRIRVFTDENNEFKPQILAEAIHLDLEGLDIEKVYGYKEANETDELYKYLLITQCNALSEVLPGMFQTISDYTELLFPDNILREGSTISKMIEMIDEEDWKDAVEIIGWLYQYYNSEKKDEVFADLKKNVKITKENIPAATQLFTPDWIVRYMVENSLGRLWLEGHPNEELRSNWIYYLDEANQEEEVEKQLEEIREEYKKIKPDEIKCIDPCSGSGHILVYMFDLLMEIYQTQGYNTRSAVKSIVENNIYGLDIDDRAAQLTYFSLMMKARQYDRGFLNRGIQPHAYAIVESNHVNRYAVEYFCNGDAKLKEAMDTIISELHDAKEYGSIITVSDQDWDKLYARFNEIQNESVMSIYTDEALGLKTLVQVAEVLSNKYMVVVTNPPYMSSSGMSEKLLSYVKKNYQDEKTDLSTVFISCCLKRTHAKGMVAMINIPVWMFISSYSNLRSKLLHCSSFINMLHLGRGVFGSDFGTTAFVIRNSNTPDYVACFRKLHTQVGTVDTLEQKEEWFHMGFGYYLSKNSWFNQIPSTPIAYWLSEFAVRLFLSVPALREVADPRQGLATGNDEKYLRFWQEVNFNYIGFGKKDIDDFRRSESKYAPFNKGGAFRKWYGNNFLIIRFSKKCYDELLQSGNHLPSRQFYFKPGITWSALTAGEFSGRLCKQGFVFAGKGPMCFANSDNDSIYLLGFLNSKITSYFMRVFSSTTDFNQGSMRDLPLIMDESVRPEIEKWVEENFDISKADWDSFETSWDFHHHPLVRDISTIAEAFDQWQA